MQRFHFLPHEVMGREKLKPNPLLFNGGCYVKCVRIPTLAEHLLVLTVLVVTTRAGV